MDHYYIDLCLCFLLHLHVISLIFTIRGLCLLRAAQAELSQPTFALAVAKWPMRTSVSESIGLSWPQVVLFMAQQMFIWVEKSYGYGLLNHVQ